MGSRDGTRTLRREGSDSVLGSTTGLSHNRARDNVSEVAVIYFSLCAVPWIVGGIVGWLSGDPTVRHVVIISALSLLLPLVWLGAVNVWQMLFWEKVPVAGPDGLQHVSTSGPLWEYRRKQH